MKDLSEIYDWLVMAFSAPRGGLLNESFYYDRRDSIFYSIHLADHLLLPDDFVLEEVVDVSNLSGDPMLLADRIKRAHLEDPTIINISRISVEEAKEAMQQFVDSIKDPVLTEILNQRIKNHDYGSRFDFYFGDEADEVIKSDWVSFRANCLLSKIDFFLILNGIDPETSVICQLRKIEDHKSG